MGARKTLGRPLLVPIPSPITDHGGQPMRTTTMAARQFARFVRACATLPWRCGAWVVRGVWRWWRDDRRLRRVLLVVDLGLVAFWVYSVEYILHHPAARGSDGFEVFLVVPMTGVVLFLSLPALLLVISNRTLRVGPWVTAMAVLANVFVGVGVLWNSGLGRGPYWPLW